MHLLMVSAVPVFSPNPLDDLGQMFHYSFMRNAFAAGTIIAVVAAVIGHFVVLRNLSFAGHALAEIGFAGATGAVALGINPFFGMLVFATGGGAAIGFLGRRIYGRDVVIGVVLAFSLGLGALFLALYQGFASEGFSLLFGDIFGVNSHDVLTSLIAGAVIIVVIAWIYRPLLFATLDPDVAEARGVPVRLLSILFMVLLAVAVSEAVVVVGVLLIFALLVTPAAIAQRLTHRPDTAIVLSIALALLFTWAGLIVSYYIPFPPGFFITAIAFGVYLLARVARALQMRVRRQTTDALQGATV
jgi:zinc/manganese transport system permease protein